MNNKVMPNDINAEEGVLGSMFFSKKAVNEKPVHIIGKVIENRLKF